MITIDTLQSAGACPPGIKWFASHFPNGGTWDEVIAALLADGHTDWGAWLGRQCPAGVPGSTWEARLALQQDNGERACLGWHCPAGVPGSTWEARLALQSDEEDRAWLGWYCPAGVPGSTWEARLAVQRNGDERARLGRQCPADVLGRPS